MNYTSTPFKTINNVIDFFRINRYIPAKKSYSHIYISIVLC